MLNQTFIGILVLEKKYVTCRQKRLCVVYNLCGYVQLKCSSFEAGFESYRVVTRVAESELKYSTLDSDFPKFPTPTSDSGLSIISDSRLRLLNRKGMKFGC